MSRSLSRSARELTLLGALIAATVVVPAAGASHPTSPGGLAGPIKLSVVQPDAGR